MENRAVDRFNDMAGGKSAQTADKGGTNGDPQDSKLEEIDFKALRGSNLDLNLYKSNVYEILSHFSGE